METGVLTVLFFVGSGLAANARRHAPDAARRGNVCTRTSKYVSDFTGAHDAPRLDTCVHGATNKVSLPCDAAMERDWRSLLFLHSQERGGAGRCRAECGAQLWLRCPPGRATPIHTPIFSSPPARPCIVERPTPFTPNAILCLCCTTQNFMQWGLSPLLSEKRDLRYLSISGT